MPQQYSVGATQISVSYLLKNPKALNKRFVNDINNRGYVSEAILQGGFPIVGGQIRYNRDDSLFPDTEGGRRNVEEVAEGARFPIIGPTEPSELVDTSKKHGLRMKVTWEMAERNELAQLDRSMRVLKNQMVDYVDGRFMAKVLADPLISAVGTQGNASARTRALGTAPYSTGPWVDTNLNVVKDLGRAKAEIVNLRLGLVPDTVLVNDNMALFFAAHSGLQDFFKNGGESAPVFQGQLPQKLMGMDIFHSPYVPSGEAWVLKRKAVGGYGNERPEQLRVLPFDEETETWEIKASRVMAFFIDIPQAMIRLTGVGTGL